MPTSFDRLGTFGRFAVVSVAAASLAGCGINSVPTAEEQAKAKWADVQAAFQGSARTWSPNLAAVAKGAAEQERGNPDRRDGSPRQGDQHPAQPG